nr:immunoglobulin heavy chain junction region [Macaca mulatta]
CNNEGDSW